MGKRLVLIAFAFSACLSSFAMGGPPIASWEDAWHLSPDRPPRPRPSEPDSHGSGPFRLEPAPPIERHDPIPNPPAQSPPIYQLADAWGRTWTHSDPTWLRTYVNGVNAQAPRARPPVRWVYSNGTACGPGGCPPR